MQLADGEFAESDNTVIDMLTVAVCRYLDEDTPMGQLDPQQKEAVGVGIHQTIATNLTEVIEALKSLEPLIIGVLQGPLADKLSEPSQGMHETGRQAAQIAFAAMCEGNRLIRGSHEPE